MCDTQQRLIIRWQINKNIFFQITFFLWASMQETKALSPSFFLFRPSHSLWLLKVVLINKNALFAQQYAKIAQNIFIHNLKPHCLPLSQFFSLPSVLNHRITMFRIYSVLIQLFLRKHFVSVCQDIYINFSNFISPLRKAWATRRVALERRATSCCLWC